ncbi:MAG: TetR/AcrR family transcriptional regulator [Actinobacteria bacterium]|nr:TetR/AcrR family transcriptional regulator [Actinomycetota bacterium]
MPRPEGVARGQRAGAAADQDGNQVQPLFPQLKPGPSRAPGAVAAHQRTRLYAAMIEACARHGYRAVTVRELATLAGVSTKTLYREFESKEDYFLATYDLVVERAIGRISGAYREGLGLGGRDWDVGLRRAFDAFADELAQRPAPSRLVLVEVLVAGPDALARAERAEGFFTGMLSGSITRAPDGVAIPPGILRALVGGIAFAARSRLLEAGSEVDEAWAPALVEWLLAYRSPVSSRLPVARLDRGSQEVGERPAVDFEDGRASFLSLLDRLCADALAEALRVSVGAPTWARGVCRAVGALFGRLAADPAFSHAALAEGFEVERRAEILRGFAEVLVRRSPEVGRPTPVAALAIVGAAWTIARGCLLRSGPGSLPASASRAAFVVLAPIVGVEAALDALVVEQRRGLGFADN